MWMVNSFRLAERHEIKTRMHFMTSDARKISSYKVNTVLTHFLKAPIKLIFTVDIFIT